LLPELAVLGQGRIGMLVELGRHEWVLLPGDLAGPTRDRLGGHGPGRAALLEIAIERAAADPEDTGGLGFADARVDGLDQMSSQIEGVGTHGKHLLDPSIITPSQGFCNLL
jgi:hypothetical protein